MINFLLAMQSVENDIRITVVRFFYNETARGFLFGFAAATLFYALLVSDKPGNIPLILTQPISATFTKLAKRDSEGRFTTSFTAFQKEYARVRITFSLAMVVFLLIVLTAVLSG